MSDQITIYLIVALNIFCQLMLIWRQKLAKNVKRNFCFLALAIPVLIMLSMRILIAGGTIHEQVAEQSLVEQFITKTASILLIAGPWLVTLAAIITKFRNRARATAQIDRKPPTDAPRNLP